MLKPYPVFFNVRIKKFSFEKGKNMFLRILKKDFKRKRTMNIILLLFVLMVVTFIGGSVKDLTILTGSLNRFLDRAGVKDFYIFLVENEQSEADMKEWLANEERVEEYEYSDSVVVGKTNLKSSGAVPLELSSTTVICGQKSEDFLFFDEKDKELHIKEGEIYLPRQIWEKNELKKGDKLTLQYDGYEKEFTAAGWFKDAIMGSNMMGTKRILVHDADYQDLIANTELLHIAAIAIETENTDWIVSEISSRSFNVMSLVDKDLIEMSYIFDVIVTLVLMVVSLCLILIALLLLRFTIGVTIQEETKEIGILKAIGIKNSRIRGLYSSKYFVLSLLGAVLGFAFSIPFGDLFIQEAAQNIVMETGQKNYFVNFFCAVLVVAFVTGFAYQCTGKMKRMSSITAIRSGNTGERFSQKGFLKLHRQPKIPAVLFLSCNDILSNFSKYMILLVTFAVGLLLIILPVNSLNTLADDSIVTAFGMQQKDIYLVVDEEVGQIVSNHSREYVENLLSSMQKTLEENGIPAEVSIELTYNFGVSKGEKSARSMAQQGIGLDAADYTCIQGDAPRQCNEIMLTKLIADKIGAVPGDTVIIPIGEEQKEYVVSGLYQSMLSMGEGIRFHQEEQIDGSFLSGYFGIQLDLQGEYTGQEIENIMEQVAGLFPDMKVFGAGDYINYFIGSITEYMGGIRLLIILVVICIYILVSVMMVKTFVTKERGEISMLKGLGFSNRSLMWWQSGRIGILLFGASALGILLSGPLSYVTTVPIFQLMGAESVDFVVRPMETFVGYPLLLLVVTMAASLLAATGIRKIHTNEINNME